MFIVRCRSSKACRHKINFDGLMAQRSWAITDGEVTVSGLAACGQRPGNMEYCPIRTDRSRTYASQEYLYSAGIIDSREDDCFARCGQFDVAVGSQRQGAMRPSHRNVLGRICAFEKLKCIFSYQPTQCRHPNPLRFLIRLSQADICQLLHRTHCWQRFGLPRSVCSC
jgi:hypothetical protein